VFNSVKLGYFKVQAEGDACCWPEACGHLASLHPPCEPVAVRVHRVSPALALTLSPASVIFGNLPGDVKLLHGKRERVPPAVTVVFSGAGDGQEGMQPSTGRREKPWHWQGDLGKGSQGLGELVPGGNSPACRCLIGLSH